MAACKLGWWVQEARGKRVKGSRRARPDSGEGPAGWVGGVRRWGGKQGAGGGRGGTAGKGGQERWQWGRGTVVEGGTILTPTLPTTLT